MALSGFIPTIWSGSLLNRLRKTQVFAAVANRNYEGEISAFGNTVKINQIGTINVSSYSENNTSITTQTLDEAQQELRIDQQKYFSFKIDDVEAAQMKPKVMTEAMDEAGYRLSDNSDQYLAGLYTEAQVVNGLGTEATGIEITSINVVEYLGLVAQKLSESDTPTTGRWMVVPPWFHQKIVLAKITLDTNNSQVFTDGYVGRALGFDFYVSNNVSTKTPATNQGARILAGYSGSITFAEQLVKMEAFRPEASFSDAVKGLYIYGGKIVRPGNTACLRADYTVEP